MKYLLMLLFVASTAVADPKYVGVAGTSLVVRHKGNNIVCEKGNVLPGTNEVIKSFDRAKVTTNKGTKTLEQYFDGERESVRPDSEGEYNQGYDDETGGAPPAEDFEDIYSAGEEKIYKYKIGQCVMHENNESNNPKDKNMIVKITGLGYGFSKNSYCSKRWVADSKKWISRGGNDDYCFGVAEDFQHESKVVECPDESGDKAPEMPYKIQQCYRYTGPLLDSKGQVKVEKTDKILKLQRARITTDPENYQYDFAEVPKEGSDEGWDYLGFKPGSENLQYLEEVECP